MVSKKILVVDDEKLIRWSLREYFSQAGYSVREASNGLEAWKMIQIEQPDLMMVDLKMPEMDGMTLLQTLKDNQFIIPSIVLTAHGDISSAVEAVKLGAQDFLQKPFDLKHVLFCVERVLAMEDVIAERNYLREKVKGKDLNLLGSSDAWLEFQKRLERLRGMNIPMILITGETGVGKGVITRTIHETGTRAKKPFVDIDCTSLPQHLLQSELFGHEKGAFTDAKYTKKGLFEIAQDGTIFLDEIGELDLSMQAKLLRSLEERQFKRVGGTENLPLRACIIAATNRNLEKEVEEGRFRADLYYRLNIIHLTIPPLRERENDISKFAEHFMERFAQQYHQPTAKIEKAAIELMKGYSWPGNIRELRNVMERIVLLDGPAEIQPKHLPDFIQGKRLLHSTKNIFQLPKEGISLEEVERSLIEQAMTVAKGNQSKAARLLNITRFTLRYRLQKFGLLGDEEA